jgi:hypothetical protein
VTWSPVAATFAGATQYTATITLTPKTGYTLTGVSENFFTVAGATTVTNTANSGVVTAVFPETVLAVGDSYGGGIVAYILQSGDPGYDASVQHGLIATNVDLTVHTTGIRWYNGSYVETGATDTAIGTGQANTTAIVNTQGAGSYAAQLCDTLVFGGYSDWFLPSKDELKKLWINQNTIGGFSSDYFSYNYYWSSSELNANTAWSLFFQIGDWNLFSKSYRVRVRAVRAF